MKKGLVLVLFFVAGLVYSQTKHTKTHYFFSIAYGQNNEVFVSDVYELTMESKDVYGKLKERFTQFQNFLVKKGGINSVTEIQTGYEKNYMLKEQAIAEQQHLLASLEKEKFKTEMVAFQM